MCAQYAKLCHIMDYYAMRAYWRNSDPIASTNRSMGNLELHVLYIGRRHRRRCYWGNWKGRRDCDYVNFFAYDNSTGRPCARKFSFHNRRNYILTRLASPARRATKRLDLHFVMAPCLTYMVSDNRTRRIDCDECWFFKKREEIG